MRRSVDFDFSFPCSYEAEELLEFPGTGVFHSPVVHFPRTDKPNGSGLWLKVKARSGKTWIGVFSRGYNVPPAFSRVLGSPLPDRVCVIADGNGYIVDVENPEVWEQIPVMPVLGVRPAVEANLLIFADFTRLAAYGQTGLVWKSQTLCWDDLKISGVTSNTIEGTGYDPTNRAAPEMRFVVELRTGRSLLPSPFQNCE